MVKSQSLLLFTLALAVSTIFSAPASETYPRHSLRVRAGDEQTGEAPVDAAAPQEDIHHTTSSSSSGTKQYSMFEPQPWIGPGAPSPKIAKSNAEDNSQKPLEEIQSYDPNPRRCKVGAILPIRWNQPAAGSGASSDCRSTGSLLPSAEIFNGKNRNLKRKRLPNDVD